MAKYQLPPLKDERLFELFVCDLLNSIENTRSYTNTDFQTFGAKGQTQKGIDIFSPQTKTVIQCKLKDVRKRDDVIRKALTEDLEQDLTKLQELTFPFDRFILASTYKDDAVLQEHLSKVQYERGLNFTLYYWGWDTLSRYVEQHEDILGKYFPQFKPKIKKIKVELPVNALGKELSKKNYISYLIKRYGDWKQIELDRVGEKFNWASFNKHLMNRYKAAGINYIDVKYFDDIAFYLQDRIDKTTFGRNQKAQGRRNFSNFEEHLKGLVE